MTINMIKDRIDIGRKKIRGIAEKRYHVHHVSYTSWIMNLCPTETLDKLEQKFNGHGLCVFHWAEVVEQHCERGERTV